MAFFPAFLRWIRPPLVSDNFIPVFTHSVQNFRLKVSAAFQSWFQYAVTIFPGSRKGSVDCCYTLLCVIPDTHMSYYAWGGVALPSWVAAPLAFLFFHSHGWLFLFFHGGCPLKEGVAVRLPRPEGPGLPVSNFYDPHFFKHVERP